MYLCDFLVWQVILKTLFTLTALETKAQMMGGMFILEGRWFDSPGRMLKCRWVGYWTPDCSWCLINESVMMLSCTCVNKLHSLVNLSGCHDDEVLEMYLFAGPHAAQQLRNSA